MHLVTPVIGTSIRLVYNIWYGPAVADMDSGDKNWFAVGSTGTTTTQSLQNRWGITTSAVSYTHLDVYKRQMYERT